MKRSLLLVTVLVLALGIAPPGCRSAEDRGPTAEPTSSAEPTPAPEPSVETTVARLYFVRDEVVGVAGREVDQIHPLSVLAKSAITELVNGPGEAEEAAGLGTAIPEGTKVNGVVIENGLATVDLSKEFESGGGSLSIQLRVAQVVYTLTQFPGVRKVAFKLDGDPVEAIGGEGLVVDPPVDRADFESVTPAILVESPYAGEYLTSPFVAWGTSNTFEATHQLEIIDASGASLAATFVTATSGTGTRGTWRQEIEFFTDVPGTGTLKAFELSAENGKPINTVDIPVNLSR